MPEDPNATLNPNAEPKAVTSALNAPPCLSQDLRKLAATARRSWLPPRPAHVMVRPSVLAFVLLLAAPLASAQEVFRGLYSPDGIVRDAAIAGDTLYVGGTFGFVGGATGTVAALDKATGAPDLSQPRFGGAVWTVIPDGTGGYFAGGEFSSVDGQPRRNLAHVRADGTLNPDFRPDPTGQINPDYFGLVETLFLDNGVLYVGGRFDFVAGQPRRNLAALNAATSALLPLSVTMQDDSQGGGDLRGHLISIVVRNSVVYLAGAFYEVNGTPRRDAAAVHVATSELLPWDIQADRDEGQNRTFVQGLALADSTLYVGGEFDRIRGQTRHNSAEVSLASPVTGDEGGEPTPWTTTFQLARGPHVVTPDYIWVAAFGTPVLWRISRVTGQTQGFIQSPYNFGTAITYDLGSVDNG